MIIAAMNALCATFIVCSHDVHVPLAIKDAHVYCFATRVNIVHSWDAGGHNTKHKGHQATACGKRQMFFVHDEVNLDCQEFRLRCVVHYHIYTTGET